MNPPLQNRLIEHENFLWRLARVRSPRIREQLLADATTSEILTIVEICLSILRYRFPLKRRHLKKLANYADTIRQLARVKSERSARRILIKGEGAMFASLLIPVLTEVASRIIKSF